MPRNTTRLDHLLNLTVWAMAVAPTATTVLFVTYGAHARLALGRWPHVYADTLPGFIFQIYDTLAGFSLLLLIISLPTIGVVAIISRFRRPAIRIRWPAMIYALGWAALIALNFLDPTGFMEWFRD